MLGQTPSVRQAYQVWALIHEHFEEIGCNAKSLGSCPVNTTTAKKPVSQACIPHKL